jgi:hypothetical protein
VRGEQFGEQVPGDVGRFLLGIHIDDPDEAIRELAGDRADQAG